MGGAALPDASVLELVRCHYDTLSFVHGNSAFEGAATNYSIDVWKHVPVDPMFLIDQNLSMSDGYFESETGKHIWRSYYEYIRDHLGYRIELQSAELRRENGRLKGEIRLVNRGFSAPVNPRKVYLRLNEHAIALDCEIRKWYSGAEQVLKIDAELPVSGKCRAGLWFPDAAPVLHDIPEYAVRCANALDFEDGVNWFGEPFDL